MKDKYGRHIEGHSYPGRNVYTADDGTQHEFMGSGHTEAEILERFDASPPDGWVEKTRDQIIAEIQALMAQLTAAQ